MKKNITMYDGTAALVSLVDGVAQLRVNVKQKTVIMADGSEMPRPKSKVTDVVLELPLSGKALTTAIARELQLTKIGHRLKITVTEYNNGHKSFDIFNVTNCLCYT